MAGYILATLDVTDPAKFDLYREKVLPLITQFQGETVINTEAIAVREGRPTRRRVIAVRFPTPQLAHDFLDCDAYGPLFRLRCEAADGEVIIVEGRG